VPAFSVRENSTQRAARIAPTDQLDVDIGILAVRTVPAKGHAGAVRRKRRLKLVAWVRRQGRTAGIRVSLNPRPPSKTDPGAVTSDRSIRHPAEVVRAEFPCLIPPFFTPGSPLHWHHDSKWSGAMMYI
jgi:hypothetical protein